MFTQVFLTLQYIHVFDLVFHFKVHLKRMHFKMSLGVNVMQVLKFKKVPFSLLFSDWRSFLNYMFLVVL